MESLPSLITSLFSNPLLYAITLVIFLILIFSGKLKVHNSNISIGNDGEKERSIIRGQIEYARCFCLGLKRYFNDSDSYRELCVIEQIFNEIVSMISFNHIRDEQDYILVKQEKIWNIVSSFCEYEYYQSDECKEIIFERTSKLIKELARIRKVRG